MATDATINRRLQTALGLLWCADSILQLQPAMWTKSLASNVIAPAASGQPALIGTPIRWVVHLVTSHPVPCNLGIAAAQLLVAIALLARFRFALEASLAWALAIWWLGEGFGMIPSGAASPLTGGPGAAVLYALTAAVALGWTSGRAAWTAAWGATTFLWLLPDSHDVHDAISGTLAAQPRVLAPLARTVAGWASGHGLTVAIVMAAASAIIAVGAGASRPSPFIAIGVATALASWFVGQAFGGLTTGQATDPNIGPLFVLLAYASRPATRGAASSPVRPAGLAGADSR